MNTNVASDIDYPNDFELDEMYELSVKNGLYDENSLQKYENMIQYIYNNKKNC